MDLTPFGKELFIYSLTKFNLGVTSSYVEILYVDSYINGKQMITVKQISKQFKMIQVWTFKRLQLLHRLN